MEWSAEMQADLLRFMREYGWEPRITTKLLNRRYGTNLVAAEVQARYWELCGQEKRNQSDEDLLSFASDEPSEHNGKTVLYWF